MSEAIDKINEDLQKAGIDLVAISPRQATDELASLTQQLAEAEKKNEIKSKSIETIGIQKVCVQSTLKKTIQENKTLQSRLTKAEEERDEWKNTWVKLYDDKGCPACERSKQMMIKQSKIVEKLTTTIENLRGALEKIRDNETNPSIAREIAQRAIGKDQETG